MARIERDSLGQVTVDDNALYGAQTQRAIDNFKISHYQLPKNFIQALAYIKLSAAEVNASLKVLDSNMAQAIAAAAKEVIAGEYDDQFPIDVFQTGSGTSTNMNMNEVLARLACQSSGLDILANDHVNMSQSSNDTIPTAIQVSAVIGVTSHVLPQVKHLKEVISKRAKTLKGIVKTGRTHLMDAMPIRFDQELEAWWYQLEAAELQISLARDLLLHLPQGGTAIGTGVNAHHKFAAKFASKIAKHTKQHFVAAVAQTAGIAGQDGALALSSALNSLAVVIMKIANDLRWMNSGPLAGLGEISLKALQPGSSIMPGKVNPVIPEAATMVAAQLIGNHTTITVAAQSGNFQLNVMLPLIAFNLLESVQISGAICQALADQAIADFEVLEDNIQTNLWKNPILVTALNPLIGYQKAAEIAKIAYKEKRSVLDVADEKTDISRKELQKLLDPYKLTEGGIAKS